MGVHLATQSIEAHRESDDQADDYLLPEGGNIENIEAITNYSEQNRADKRTGDLALAAR